MLREFARAVSDRPGLYETAQALERALVREGFAIERVTCPLVGGDASPDLSGEAAGEGGSFKAEG
jgi:hypothetical protein